MCKKIISFLLTLMMISGMISIPVMAEDSSASTPTFGDEVVIADFTKMDDINKAGMQVDSVNKLFGDKSGTISQTHIDGDNIAMDPFIIDSSVAPTDWSDYTHLNLWVYSPKDTSEETLLKFVVLMRTPGTSSNFGYNLQYQSFSGWKKISVDLSKIVTPGDDKATYGHGSNFDMKNVDATYVSYEFSNINGSDFGKTGYEGNEVSFAKIWLSKEAEEEAVTDATKEVYNSHSTSTTKALLNDTKDNTYAVLTSTVFDSNDQSLKLTGTGAVGNASRDWILHSDQSSEDWSSYNYLNFRIKNASTNADGSAKNGSFGFRMFSKAGGYWWKSNLHAITDTEWHTFSVKIPDELVHSTGSATSMNDIYALKLLYISGTMYLEKIWLSTEDPNAPVVAPTLENTSVESGATVSAYTRSIDFKYSKNLDSDVVPAVTIAPAADYVVSCEKDTVQLIFPEALAAGTEYTVTVSGVSEDTESVTFSTENYSAERSDSAVYARYASSEYTSGRMIVAVYTEDDSLEKVDVIEDVNSEDILTLKNDYVSVYSDQRAKIFVWEYETLKPLEVSKEF